MIIYKGEDKKIELTVENSSCVPVDLSTVLGITVVIYQKGHEIQRYNEPATVGFDPITITDALNGVIEINLQSADTLLGKVGKDIFIAIKLQTIQVSFDSGTYDAIQEDIKIGRLENARTKLIDP